MNTLTLSSVGSVMPVAGNTIRMLDADLYDAGQQSGDIENISATGNLNVGNILQYDEHVRRTMEGAVSNSQAAANMVHSYLPTNSWKTIIIYG